MKLSRDSWLAIGLFAALAVLTAVSVIQQTEPEELPALSSASSAPDGARALWLWLEALNYDVRDDVGTAFSIPPDVGLVLILEPLFNVVSDEWEVIDEWVEEGGDAKSGVCTAGSFKNSA